jgi:serine/threonine protein phosphatase PrpC
LVGTVGGVDGFKVIQRDEFCHRDHVGELITCINGRFEQQDAIAFGANVWAVADGLGGHERGADASRVAVEVLAASIDAPCRTQDLVAGFAAADDAVRALVAHDPLMAPGSTLVAVARSADGAHLCGAWIGDSRAYLYDPKLRRRADRLSALTKDHAGPFGFLTSCLGSRGDHGFTVGTFSVPVGEQLKVVLCTDGAFRDLDDWDFAALMSRGARAVVKAAADPHGDNVTVAVVDVDAFAAG